MFWPSGTHQYSTHSHMCVCVRVCVCVTYKYIRTLQHNSSTYTTAQHTLDIHLCTRFHRAQGTGHRAHVPTAAPYTYLYYVPIAAICTYRSSLTLTIKFIASYKCRLWNVSVKKLFWVPTYLLAKIPSKLFVLMEFTWQFYSLTFKESPDLIKFK